MTMLPDDLDLTPDLQEAVAPEETTSEVTSDTPEVIEEQPASAAPQLDLTQQVAELVQMQKAQFEAQQTQARQAANPAPAAWVDPFDRPENQERLAELEEQAVYDPAAMRQLNALNRQLMQEQFRHDLEVERQTMRQEMTARQAYEQATGSLRTEASRYGELVDTSTLTEIENEVFANIPEHQRAMALQDPTMRKLLTEAAAGRRVLSGKQPNPNAPARPAAPPAVQSSSRAPTPASKATNAHYNDAEWLEGALHDAFLRGTGAKK